MSVHAAMADLFEVPIVGAPLAGGPSTPALAAAVSEAGGLGFLAAGYKTAAAVAAELEELRTLTARPVGLNLFYPAREEVDETAVDAYATRMRSEGERYGVPPGEPRWTDDDWPAKLELAARERPAVVSFTFGCPGRDVVEWLRSSGCRVWCTVTSRAEAEQATEAGVDALVVQGAEAGGHQGSFHDHDDEPRSLHVLLEEIARATATPLVAAGAIASGGDIARALAAGAVAAQLGSALLLATEAGTSTPHRRALQSDGTTRLTRAFTGGRARHRQPLHARARCLRAAGVPADQLHDGSAACGARASSVTPEASTCGRGPPTGRRATHPRGSSSSGGPASWPARDLMATAKPRRYGRRGLRDLASGD